MIGRLLLVIYISSYFARFTSRVPELGLIRFELILGILLIACVVLSGEKDKFRLSCDISKRLYLFLVDVILSLPFVTWPGSVVRFHLEEWIKVVLFYVFIVVFIRTQSQLKVIFYGSSGKRVPGAVKVV